MAANNVFISASAKLGWAQRVRVRDAVKKEGQDLLHPKTHSCSAGERPPPAFHLSSFGIACQPPIGFEGVGICEDFGVPMEGKCLTADYCPGRDVVAINCRISSAGPGLGSRNGSI